MNNSTPAWLVKTRPCPFYQQGRCLFADSCNFLHSVSVKAPTESMRSQVVNVTSPMSNTIPLAQSPHSPLSPSRSAQMSDLLFALKDVIGETSQELPPNDSSEEPKSPQIAPQTQLSPLTESRSFPLPPSPHENHAIPVRSGSPSTLIPPLQLDDEDTLRPPFQPDDTVTGSAMRATQPSSDTDQTDSSASVPTSNLLSPVNLSVELTQLQAMQLLGMEAHLRKNSQDSGYADSWKSPLRPFTRSPPRSPSIGSTFDLLASPFGTHSSRILSPRLNPFGVYHPSSPFASGLLSPGPMRTVENDDIQDDFSLDSPSDFVTAVLPNAIPSLEDHTELPEEETASLEEIFIKLTSPRRDSTNPQTVRTPEVRKEDNVASGSTPVWDTQTQPTAVYIGNAAVAAETHEDMEPTVSSVQVEADEEGTDPDHFMASPTAELAYLDSPGPVEENDTLHSLYEVYSEFDEEDSPRSPREVVNLEEDRPESRQSRTPVRSGLLRERVFTPPPTGYQSRPTTPGFFPPSTSTLPPLSLSSLDSVEGRSSPFSARSRDNKSNGSVTSSQSPGSQEIEISKKVPFGFRGSLALGRAGGSSIISHRGSRSGPYPSPVSASSQSSSSHERVSPLNELSKSPRGALKPLRLSVLLNKSTTPPSSRNSINSIYRRSGAIRTSISSTSRSPVNFSNSLTRSSSFSSPPPAIPERRHNTLMAHHDRSEAGASNRFSSSSHSTIHAPPQSAPLSRTSSWRRYSRSLTEDSDSPYQRPHSSMSAPPSRFDDDSDDTYPYNSEANDDTIESFCQPLSAMPRTAPASRESSVVRPSMYAIATPKPVLMFAIASDNVDEVRKVLNSGEAGPNDAVGPQSALEFALTNDQLTHRLEIVKTLLAFGADPSVANRMSLVSRRDSVQVAGNQLETNGSSPLSPSIMDTMDPAMRYYVKRADAPHTRRTSALIYRSLFRPLTRVRYELIGQDWALEYLFDVLSKHSRRVSLIPIVVLLCGPSGHGKSLLARKFGALLDVPTHTVNMPTLRTPHDLWKSFSMSPYEPPSTCTLAEFLINNEGKRCVVVLDEIEKTEDDKILWLLLMPWESGWCSFEAGGRRVDVRNVVWLGTSNIGHSLVFEHHDSRERPEQMMRKEEFSDLMELLRPQVSDRLGASILSRVTIALPFVPFTFEERRAICTEALYSIVGDAMREVSSDIVEEIIKGAMAAYRPSEGARSLYRAVSNEKLVDSI